MAKKRKSDDQHIPYVSQNSEELFRAFAKQNIDGVILINPQATIVEWNQIMEEVTGLRSKSTIGMKAWDMQMAMVTKERRTPKARARYKEEFLQILRTGLIPEQIAANETQINREDNKVVFVEQKLFIIQTANGNWLGALVRDITERMQAEKQIRQQTARAEALAAFSKLLTQANQDYRLVLDTVVRKCAEFIGDGASVFLYSPGNEFLELAAVYNTNPEAIDVFRQEMLAHPISVDEGAYKQVITAKQPVLFPVIPIEKLIEASSPERRNYYKKLPLHSMMLAPLHVQGELLGIIGLGRHVPDKSYTTEDLTFLQDMADRSALAMLNARLYQELEQKLEEREALIRELEIRNAQSETLRETTSIVASTLDVSEAVHQILEQLKRVVRYDSASVWLYKGKDAEIIGYVGLSQAQIAPGVFAINEVEPDYPLIVDNLPYILLDDVQENYPQFRIDELSNIHAWMAIPLRARGKLTGFISLDGNEPGQFTEQDAQLALTYADQVSIALENARLFSDLQTELKERKRLIAELEEKNAELERFTYTVSHDLKSPLITINGFMGYLEEDIASGDIERVKKDTNRIQEAVNKMYYLLEDLLELSRIGRLMNPPQVVSFNEIVQDALNIVHGQIEARGVTIELDPNLPTVYGDRQRLTEVLQNLIDNASKFMGDQPDPRIRIGLNKGQNGEPTFFIEDNGIGIAPEYHEKVFGLFNKLDPKAEGTGVGLALVKRIIEFHGGRIWVESEAGAGSTFCFILPLG